MSGIKLMSDDEVRNQDMDDIWEEDNTDLPDPIPPGGTKERFALDVTADDEESGVPDARLDERHSEAFDEVFGAMVEFSSSGSDEEEQSTKHQVRTYLK